MGVFTPQVNTVSFSFSLLSKIEKQCTSSQTPRAKLHDVVEDYPLES